MHNTNSPELRRSSRVPVNVPILVTCLQPGANFSEVCETMVVSAHGCAMRSPMKLEAGVPLHFHNQEGRETTAQVVYCKPSGTDRQTWTLGASFDRPENFWGLTSCPKDWMQFPAPSREKSAAKLAPTGLPAGDTGANCDGIGENRAGENPQATFRRASQGRACRTCSSPGS